MKGIRLSGNIDMILEVLRAISRECKTVAEYVEKTENIEGVHMAILFMA